LSNVEDAITGFNTFAEKDSYIQYDIDELKDIKLDDIKKEIKWENMMSQGYPVPRLISVQGDIVNELKPLYRHPADEQPVLVQFTKTTEKIARIISKKLKQKFNHVLVQLYRDGQDNIGEHSDKTLDIAHGTNIVNYSIGATRIMKLRNKSNKLQTENVRLLHNSLFVFGPNSNKKWLHGINKDGRPDVNEDDDEKSFNGERISFTFRTIATFIDQKNNIIGQGAVKNKKDNNNEQNLMFKAFSKENNDIDFEWEKYYGNGFGCISIV